MYLSLVSYLIFYFNDFGDYAQATSESSAQAIVPKPAAKIYINNV